MRDRAAVEALRVVDPATDLGFVLEAIGCVRAGAGRTRRRSSASRGGPFTLAAYLHGGRPSRDQLARPGAHAPPIPRRWHAADGPARGRDHRLRARPGRAREPTSSSCSTRGPASLTADEYRALVAPCDRARSWRPSTPLARRRSTRSRGRRASSARSPRRARRSSAIDSRQSLRHGAPAARALARPSRATSTRRSSLAGGPRSGEAPARVLADGRPPRPHLQHSARPCRATPTRRPARSRHVRPRPDRRACGRADARSPLDA